MKVIANEIAFHGFVFCSNDAMLFCGATRVLEFTIDIFLSFDFPHQWFHKL